MSVELQTSFIPVFQANSGGVDGFDLSGKADHAFTLDYDHSWKMDHLFFYRRGGGAVAIVRNDGNGGLRAVFNSNNGIPGFDFSGQTDHAFAFDYESSGRMDYVCAYRPGAGLLTIAWNGGGRFQPVIQSDSGIGGYDVKDAHDRGFAFDFDHSGKRDYICLYRPSYGHFYIYHNNQGNMEAVYAQKGLGDMPFTDALDRAFAFDYDRSGRMDYILCYRPGHSAVSIMQNANGKFAPVWNTVDPYKNSIVFYSFGGYDCADQADRAFPFDFDSSGKLDHVVMYRPGKGCFYVLEHLMGGWWPVYQAHGAGMGIVSTTINKMKSLLHPDAFRWVPPIYDNGLSGASGYDVKSIMDRCLPFDFESTGCSDHVVMYRPGAGILWIVRRADMPAQQAQQAQ